MADIEKRRLSQLVFHLIQIGWLKRVLWLADANEIGFTVAGEVPLIAAQPRLRIGRPPNIDTIRWRMIPTINQRDGAALFAEIHLAILTFHIKVAVYKQDTLAKGTPERFLTIEVKVATAIDSVSVQGIVRTFEMTILVIRILRTTEWIQVQTTDETHIFSDQTGPMHIAHMSLRNGIAAFLSIKQRISWINKVNIAIIAHRQILDRQRIAPEVEHREITNSPLHLASLTGKNNILRTFAFPDEMYVFTLYDHTKRLTSVLSDLDRCIVRIVNPIDARIDIDGDTVAKMRHSILKTGKHERCMPRCICINQDVKGVKALSKSQ